MTFVLGAGPDTAIHPWHVIHFEPPLYFLINADVSIIFLPADEDCAALSGKNDLSALRNRVIGYALTEIFGVEHNWWEISDDDLVFIGQQNNQPRVAACDLDGLVFIKLVGESDWASLAISGEIVDHC